MPKLINVPQGYSGRFSKITPVLDLEGVYSDGFSICNMVIGVGEDGFFLMHADDRTYAPFMDKEFAWLGEVQEIIVLHRVGETMLKKSNSDYFKAKNTKVTEIAVDARYEGVAFFLQAQQGDAPHPRLRFFEERPDNLMHHPREQELVTVQKIKQLVGQREHFVTKKISVTAMDIFTGYAFANFPEACFKIDTTHPITKEEMDFFKPNEPFIVFTGKVGGCRKANIESGIPILDRGLKEDNKSDFMQIFERYHIPLAFHLQSYVYQYNAIPILKCNILDSLANQFKPQAEADHVFVNAVKQLLNKSADVSAELEVMLNGFKEKPSQNPSKNPFLAECALQITQHKQRKFYDDLNKKNQTLGEKVTSLSQQALRYYQTKDYPAAYVAFLGGLQILTCYALENSKALATAHYNCGKSLLNQGKHAEALNFLQVCFVLRRFNDPANLEKVNLAIAECERSLPNLENMTLKK